MARRNSHRKVKPGQPAVDRNEKLKVAVVIDTNRISMIQIVFGLNTVIETRGWALRLHRTHEEVLRPWRLGSASSDDVVIAATVDGKSIAPELRGRVPVVSLMEDLTALSIPSVVVDERAV